MKPMLVGMAPGLGTGPVLGGRVGDRLAELLGCSPAELRRRFRLKNTLRRYPGSAGKGDAFPMAEAREAAKRMRLQGDVVILGRANAEAHGLGKWPMLTWHRRSESTRVAWMPHPSGVNVWWNDSGNVAAARWFLRELRGGGEDNDAR